MWARFLGLLLENTLSVDAPKSGRPILYLVKEYLNEKIRDRTAFLTVFAPRMFAGLALAESASESHASGYYISELQLVKTHLCTWRHDAPDARIIDTLLQQEAEVVNTLVNGGTFDGPAV